MLKQIAKTTSAFIAGLIPIVTFFWFTARAELRAGAGFAAWELSNAWESTWPWVLILSAAATLALVVKSHEWGASDDFAVFLGGLRFRISCDSRLLLLIGVIGIIGLSVVEMERYRFFSRVYFPLAAYNFIDTGRRRDAERPCDEFFSSYPERGSADTKADPVCSSIRQSSSQINALVNYIQTVTPVRHIERNQVIPTATEVRKEALHLLDSLRGRD